ncbi:hypothetical protein JZY91_10130 [Corynebacterium sp. CNCTC7651]|uniref:hypothetical protein n=1 Tax=Corynebacterium sp. CNCTC7651 TaxID=2815361 RepID=UPI001F2BE4BE|nr:hypothetical protein [Corynebacterium sp. CNCTC7651]UIZ92016.1 hypothetical protein JZY91_10130 [Corynebacterium sp. CNCTC7651]
MRRVLGALCVSTFAFLGLTACGGSATVDGDGATVTPTTTTATSSTATATTTETATSSSPRASGGAALPPADGDRPAREVETIPNQATAFTPAEEAFLEDLREHGLNVEGVEDQLTATGFSVCSNDVITRDAVAGQLVEQRRTDMDPAALAELLTDTARANLC